MADIKPASPADFGQIAALTRALTTAAFADDAVMRWFFPDRDEYERWHPIGRPCHLETENVAYDAHHGVEIRSEWELPPGGPHMSGMFRAARSVADG